MSQIYKAPSGGGGITTIDGDVGSVTGSTVTFTGGSTGFTFNGSGTTMTLEGSVSPVSPAAQISISDDFLSTATETGDQAGSFVCMLGQLSWSNNVAPSANYSGAFQGLAAYDVNHPGLIYLVGLGSGETAILALNSLAGSGYNYNNKGYPFLVGGGQITCNWVFNIVTLSNGTNTYQLNVGFGSIYFGYSDGVNSGKWVLTGESGSHNTAVTVTTGWHNAQLIISADATTLTFKLDGSTLYTFTGQTPLVAPDGPTFSVAQLAGTIASDSIEIDLFYLNQTLTTSR